MKKFLAVLCALCGVPLCLALDRNAFTFTNYDLEVRVGRAAGTLEGRGRLTLRNDSNTPQRHAVLQVSSTLSWKGITLAGKQLAYAAQPYVSDIDHTGALSEAAVNLKQPVLPRATVELEIAYAGTVPADATRLMRIGTPEQTALRSDWDQISEAFTAVRGIGYVAWYPIATESASLSNGNEVFDVIGAWKRRHADSRMRVNLCSSPATLTIVMAGGGKSTQIGAGLSGCRSEEYAPLGTLVPSFALGELRATHSEAVRLFSLAGHESMAADYARVASEVQPLVTQWFGASKEQAQLVELPDENAAGWESGAMLFLPLKTIDQRSLELMLVHQLTHAAFRSPRPWIDEGAAHFAQALQREKQQGRAAALSYLAGQLAPLAAAEKQFLPDAPGRAPAAAEASERRGQSLITATDEVFYRTKALYVWWMLRDMLGDQAMQRAFQSYRAAEDKDASYMQRLLQGHSHRQLEWFFDDWVYRDRGLPDFRISAAYPRALLPVDYSVTVTVENLGSAGAEVPVFVRADKGEVMKRLEVRAREKAVVRLPIPAVPKQAQVNDGSVPEANAANNRADIAMPDSSR